MRRTTLKIIKLRALFMVLSGIFSCNNDHDLIAEYVLLTDVNSASQTFDKVEIDHTSNTLVHTKALEGSKGVDTVEENVLAK